MHKVIMPYLLIYVSKDYFEITDKIMLLDIFFIKIFGYNFDNKYQFCLDPTKLGP